MKRLAAASALACASFSSHAAVAWYEGASGDLSNNPATAQSVTLSAGSNLVFGTTGQVDRDYFRVSIAPGNSLTGITALASSPQLPGVPGVVTPFNLSFAAVQMDDGVFWDPTTNNPAGLLGWTHFSTVHVGTTILDDIGAGFGATGFTPPLGPGSYVFLVQDTGGALVTYGLDFTLAVPEPETYALLLAGFGLLGFIAPRRKRL